MSKYRILAVLWATALFAISLFGEPEKLLGDCDGQEHLLQAVALCVARDLPALKWMRPVENIAPVNDAGELLGESLGGRRGFLLQQEHDPQARGGRTHSSFSRAAEEHDQRQIRSECLPGALQKPVHPLKLVVYHFGVGVSLW